MLTVLSSLFSLFGTGISSFFGFKQAQVKSVQSAIDFIGGVDNNDAREAAAAAQALQQILTQGIWIEKVWRPTLMMILMGIIGSYWFFGYTPPYFDQPMSPMMVEIFSMLKIGLVGYIPARSIEKIMTNIQIGSILKTLISKKLG